MLLGFRIRNFALLRDCQIGSTWQTLLACRQKDAPTRVYPLRPLSAIIGRNNSGKTQVFDALDFIGDCIRYSVPYASNLHDRGGFRKLRSYHSDGPLEFDFSILAPWKTEILHYSISMNMDHHGRPYVLKEEADALPIDKTLVAHARHMGAHPDAAITSHDGASDAARPLLRSEGEQATVYAEERQEVMELADSKRPVLATFGRILRYRELRAIYRYLDGIFYLRLHPDFRTQQSTRERAEQGGHRHLNIDASNIRNVLSYLKHEDEEKYRAIMKRINDRMPRSQRLDDRSLDHGINDSEVKLFTLLLLLEDPHPRSLILLENPDEALYHDMVECLATALRDYSLNDKDRQLIFSTHSAILLETLSPPEVWVLSRSQPGKKTSLIQSLEESGPEPYNERMDHADEHMPVPERNNSGSGSGTSDSGSKARCIAEIPEVRAMYKEGVGLGALWYAGHFDIGEGEG